MANTNQFRVRVLDGERKGKVMVFNAIRGLERTGMVASVVGNERTMAKNEALREAVRAAKGKLAVTVSPRQRKEIKEQLSDWEKELKRLGFENYRDFDGDIDPIADLTFRMILADYK